MLLPTLAIGLLLAHLLVAYLGGGAATPAAQWLGLAVQGVAVLAVLRQRGRAAAVDRVLWRLLAYAAGMQMLWTACNLLAPQWPEHAVALLQAGVTLSGLSMIPALYLIARSFNRQQPRAILVLDATLSLVAAGLLYLLIQLALAGGNGVSGPNITLIIHHADAIGLLLASMATLRLFGAGGSGRRRFYLSACAYLWINGAVAALYNRIEMSGLPWWGGVLIDLPGVALALVAALPNGRWLRHGRPSLRGAELIAAFAPIVFSLAVLLLAISVSRVSFVWGMIAATLAVIVYGVHVAFIHSQHLEIQRLSRLGTRRLQQQVARDPLTGIANRIGLDARLRGLRGGQDCSLLMIDIDYFKQFNDSQGHVVGDACLVEVATALAAALPAPEATVARYGGEEFAVVLPNTPVQAARDTAQQLLLAIERRGIAHPASPLGVVTVSIGIATRPASAAAAIALLRQADAALYRAKHGGRNRCAHAQDAAADAQSVATPG
ncbi:GGDEF domain-containing protein [Xanthomonas sp. AmX2]|uniref:diguanylate cyclase n=1 Tax=Xanthomonas sp. TaxID=29446 RepID=UPI00197F26C3|nr:GGDEF domain-containing protein [Xanthomonas sp.]